MIEGGTACVYIIFLLLFRRDSLGAGRASLKSLTSAASNFSTHSAQPLLSAVSTMSYYMDPVSSYPALHPCDCLAAMRQNGGVAVGPQLHLLAAVQHQQQCYPSQPFHPHDIPLQEVPNGHELCPTAYSHAMVMFTLTQPRYTLPLPLRLL
ncbi:uncharacterized protein LOC144083639 [Stigmatopora argus]